MHCSEVTELLSAYHDGELTELERAKVQAHLERCPDCKISFAELQTLSSSFSELTSPSPPDALWTRIEASLEKAPPQSRVRRLANAIRSRRGLFSLAASVLVAGLVYFCFPTSDENDHKNHIAVDFNHYLTEFTRDPKRAQNTLLANYNGRGVDLIQAAAQLKYQPATASLPDGYTIDAVYMLDMPCCKCAQTIVRCPDGSMLAVFEHDRDQPIWFGDRSSVQCQCGGKPTRVVEFDSRLAATWQSGDRYLTIIGAKDLDQVVRLVTEMGQDVRDG